MFKILQSIQKVKLLYQLLIIINVLTLILIVIQMFGLVIPDMFNSKVYNNNTLGKYNNLVLTSLLLLILVGSFQIQLGIKHIIHQGFFNQISGIKFRFAGRIVLVFAMCRIVYIMITTRDFELNEVINNTILAFLIILVGLGLLIFSDFIKNGGVLKQENDLTI